MDTRTNIPVTKKSIGDANQWKDEICRIHENFFQGPTTLAFDDGRFENSFAPIIEFYEKHESKQKDKISHAYYLSLFHLMRAIHALYQPSLGINVHIELSNAFTHVVRNGASNFSDKEWTNARKNFTDMCNHYMQKLLLSVFDTLTSPSIEVYLAISLCTDLADIENTKEILKKYQAVSEFKQIIVEAKTFETLALNTLVDIYSLSLSKNNQSSYLAPSAFKQTQIMLCICSMLLERITYSLYQVQAIALSTTPAIPSSTVDLSMKQLQELKKTFISTNLQKKIAELALNWKNSTKHTLWTKKIIDEKKSLAMLVFLSKIFYIHRDHLQIANLMYITDKIIPQNFLSLNHSLSLVYALHICMDRLALENNENVRQLAQNYYLALINSKAEWDVSGTQYNEKNVTLIHLTVVWWTLANIVTRYDVAAVSEHPTNRAKGRHADLEVTRALERMIACRDALEEMAPSINWIKVKTANQQTLKSILNFPDAFNSLYPIYLPDLSIVMNSYNRRTTLSPAAKGARDGNFLASIQDFLLTLDGALQQCSFFLSKKQISVDTYRTSITAVLKEVQTQLKQVEINNNKILDQHTLDTERVKQAEKAFNELMKDEMEKKKEIARRKVSSSANYASISHFSPQEKKGKDEIEEETEDSIFRNPQSPMLEAAESLKQGIEAFSQQQYHLSLHYFHQCNMMQSEFAVDALEGEFACLIKILSLQIIACTETILTIKRNVKKISPEIAEIIYHNAVLLYEKYQSWQTTLITKAKKISVSEEALQLSQHWWKTLQEDLNVKMMRLSTVHEETLNKFIFQRYKSIMKLAVSSSEKVISEEKYKILFNIGYQDHVLGQDQKSQDQYGEYRALYKAGRKLFYKLWALRNTNNINDKNGSLCHYELLKQLEDNLIEKSDNSIESTPSSSSTSSAAVSFVFTESSSPQNPTSQSSTTKKSFTPREILTKLQKMSFPMDKDISRLAQWTKQHPEGLCMASHEEDPMLCKDIYEHLSQCFLSPSFLDWMVFLDKSGWMNWCLSIPLNPQPIYITEQPTYKTRFNHILNELQQFYDLTNTSDLLNHIWAHVIVSYYVFAYQKDPSILQNAINSLVIDNNTIAFNQNPIQKAYKLLPLTDITLEVVQALISTAWFVIAKPKQIPVSDKTIDMLFAKVIEYNIPIYENADIHQKPALLMSYGNWVISQLAEALNRDKIQKSKQIDILCTLPLDKLPFPTRQCLNYPLFYYRCLPGNQTETNDLRITLTNDLSNFLNTLEVTVHCIIYSWITEQYIYFNENAISDLNQKQLRPVYPIKTFFDLSKQWLHLLMNERNYGFSWQKETEQLFTDLINKAVQENSAQTFLQPLTKSNPQVLMSFFINGFLTNPNGYIDLLIKHQLLPFIFPIPQPYCLSFGSKVVDGIKGIVRDEVLRCVDIDDQPWEEKVIKWMLVIAKACFDYYKISDFDALMRQSIPAYFADEERHSIINRLNSILPLLANQQSISPTVYAKTSELGQFKTPSIASLPTPTASLERNQKPGS